MGQYKTAPVVSALATILVVDDEESIREFLCEVLALMGYRALAAPDGLAALAIYRRRFREIDFVLTDFVMPGLHGVQVLDLMRDLNPALKAALMSGYYGDADLTADCLANIVGMLRKPFSAEQLQGLLDKALLPGGPRVGGVLTGSSRWLP